MKQEIIVDTVMRSTANPATGELTPCAIGDTTIYLPDGGITLEALDRLVWGMLPLTTFTIAPAMTPEGIAIKMHGEGEAKPSPIVPRQLSAKSMMVAITPLMDAADPRPHAGPTPVQLMQFAAEVFGSQTRDSDVIVEPVFTQEEFGFRLTLAARA